MLLKETVSQPQLVGKECPLTVGEGDRARASAELCPFCVCVQYGHGHGP